MRHSGVELADLKAGGVLNLSLGDGYREAFLRIAQLHQMVGERGLNLLIGSCAVENHDEVGRKINLCHLSFLSRLEQSLPNDL